MLRPFYTATQFWPPGFVPGVLLLLAVSVGARAEEVDWREADPGIEVEPQSESSEPSDSSLESRLVLQAGVYSPSLDLLSDASRGATTVLPILGVGYRLESSWFPEANLTLQAWATPLARTLADGAGESRSFSGVLVAGARRKTAEFRAGVGLLFQWVRGSGGTSEQSNGLGTTTFFRPERNVLLHVLVADLGVAWELGRWRAGVDTIWISPFSERRDLALTFQLGWLY